MNNFVKNGHWVLLFLSVRKVGLEVTIFCRVKELSVLELVLLVRSSFYQLSSNLLSFFLFVSNYFTVRALFIDCLEELSFI